jgi:hypothetical protein
VRPDSETPGRWPGGALNNGDNKGFGNNGFNNFAGGLGL